jgi:hypothetical protein
VPYHKGTRHELADRRTFVAQQLARGVPKMSIHRMVRERFNVQWRQCDRYISWLTRARALEAKNGLTHCRDEKQSKSCETHK